MKPGSLSCLLDKLVAPFEELEQVATKQDYSQYAVWSLA